MFLYMSSKYFNKEQNRNFVMNFTILHAWVKYNKVQKSALNYPFSKKWYFIQTFSIPADLLITSVPHHIETSLLICKAY